MNWLFWVVVVFIGYHVIDGLRRGFIRKAVSALSLIITLVLVTWLTPKVNTFLQDYTSVHEKIQETCSELLMDSEYNTEVKTDQVQMIENMNLPDNLKEMLLENNNAEAYSFLNVSGFSEYVGAYLANVIVNAVAYLLTFLIVWTVIRVILAACDVVTMLPVLHGVNKLAGGVLGIAEAVVFIWIAFLIVAIFCNGEVGQMIFGLISENVFLSLLYSQNLIMKIVFGLIF